MCIQCVRTYIRTYVLIHTYAVHAVLYSKFSFIYILLIHPLCILACVHNHSSASFYLCKSMYVDSGKDYFPNIVPP